MIYKRYITNRKEHLDIKGYKRGNRYIIDGNVVKMELHRRTGDNMWTTFDLKHLDKVINHEYTWCAKQSTSNKQWYAIAAYINEEGKKTSIQLQMFIMDLGGGHEKVADHINHDTLDNREENLRVINNSQNLRHRKGKNITNKSGYRNVSVSGNKWLVSLRLNGKPCRLGLFDDVDEAGEYAKLMREKYYGEYAGEC